jgi:hypothetical protein
MRLTGLVTLGALALGGCYTSGVNSLYSDKFVQPIPDGVYVSGENTRLLKRMPDGRYAMLLNANKKASEVRLAVLPGQVKTFVGQVNTEDGNIYVAIRPENNGFAVLRPSCSDVPDQTAAKGYGSHEPTMNVCQFTSAKALEGALTNVIAAAPASRWDHYVKR